MKEFRGAATLGVACALLWAWPLAGTTAPSSAARVVVTPSEQAARDDERMRILQAELAREQGHAAEAARRHAERLAARDPRGAADAEQAQSRAADNLAALRREIDTVAKPAGQPTPVAAARATPITHRSAPPPAANGPAATPWWDVYARAPRRPDSSEAPRATSLLLRPPPPAAAAHAPQFAPQRGTP